ncbi:hypothetical protein E4T66_18610 [Sinimarinibacterium sp. CAU 1509]|uniref:hypothetical protein n=1 Tax=Sinimarinibacterium sp. CAU 1509 TaxID=2562283 RepID=UPI0010ACE54D|nr:hypothetical protein [Sinimarinibacterium sp. CAU 1509]TJY57420.1 hypothetical protein E4T66_18610 [Sinimarinibacterium sp. CAU 1509]
MPSCHPVTLKHAAATVFGFVLSLGALSATAAPPDQTPSPTPVPFDVPVSRARVIDPIAQLRAECVAEARQAAPVKSTRDTACRRYEQAVAGGQDASINVVPPAERRATPRAAAPASRPAAPAPLVPPVAVVDCRHLTYGSIRYRHCRADEKERLLRSCRDATDRAEQLHGDERIHAKAIAQAKCVVAERYQIVD